MKEVFLATCAAAVLLTAVVALHRWGQRKSDLMVRNWAEKNHLELLHFRERALFESAPFPFLGSNKTPNYYVRVRDHQGKERHGWIQLGTGIDGIWGEGKDKVHVKWDEEAQ